MVVVGVARGSGPSLVINGSRFLSDQKSGRSFVRSAAASAGEGATAKIFSGSQEFVYGEQVGYNLATGSYDTGEKNCREYSGKKIRTGIPSCLTTEWQTDRW
jgi:hypothetical protein